MRRKAGASGEGNDFCLLNWLCHVFPFNVQPPLLNCFVSSDCGPLEDLILIWNVCLWCVSLRVSCLDLHTPKSWGNAQRSDESLGFYLQLSEGQHVHCWMPFHPRADFLAAVAISAQLKQPLSPQHTHTPLFLPERSLSFILLCPGIQAEHSPWLREETCELSVSA